MEGYFSSVLQSFEQASEEKYGVSLLEDSFGAFDFFSYCMESDR